jgi:maltooligosyltrehalose trehalohydrolase
MKAIGARYTSDGKCSFCVWAPEKESMTLHFVSPDDHKVEMNKDEHGYFTAELNNITPGCTYYYMPNGTNDRPDPVSFYQPEGVHGPSQVVAHDFNWTDTEWRGLPFKDLIIYELHVGTFTEEGTFESIIPRLDDIISVGINAIEIMPVAQFPGKRNWGYDGVFPFSVQNSYGGIYGLKKLIDACHAKGIAVILDVVYNHLGPEGNYLSEYGPYFTDIYHTPWGKAINYDGEWSDGVREYFCSNLLYWFEHFHLDGLRLDAIHTIYDFGAVHFWELVYKEVKDLEQRLGRHFYVIAESDSNDPKVVRSPEAGGYGFTAQWLDDFHHAFYVLLDKAGIVLYEDFGQMEQLAKAYKEGFVHAGEFVKFRKRKHGASSAGIPGNKFIVFNQNHDQVGNRVDGGRLSTLIDFELLKVAAAAILLSSYIPMLFMGEEYGENAPFYYFIDHSDPELLKAVREGRKKEFEKYKWHTYPPDPHDEQTFNSSRINWDKRTEGHHAILLQWHKELINLRRNSPALQSFEKGDIQIVTPTEQSFLLHRKDEGGEHHALILFNLSTVELSYTLPHFGNTWVKQIDSKDHKWVLRHDNKKGNDIPLQLKAGQQINIAPASVIMFTNIF